MKRTMWVLSLLLMAAIVVTSCKKKEPVEPDPEPPVLVGIQGKWESSGTDVAPLLVALFATDSIFAEFKTDMTYLVEQYDTGGAKLTLTGTYTQSASGTGNIWNITVNQTAPAALTSTGIFEVYAGDSVYYEIVQTQPDIGAVPPTATAGFGSTNGGAFGMMNVQKYRKVD